MSDERDEPWRPMFDTHPGDMPDRVFVPPDVDVNPAEVADLLQADEEQQRVELSRDQVLSWLVDPRPVTMPRAERLLEGIVSMVADEVEKRIYTDEGKKENET